MNTDGIQQTPPKQPTPRLGLRLSSRQAVTGLTPPQTGEAIIREIRPSVSAHPAVSGLAQKLTDTMILAPLAWLMLAPLFALKYAPFAARRYTLTNRRLMIQRGLKPRLSRKFPSPTLTKFALFPPAIMPFIDLVRWKSSPTAKSSCTFPASRSRKGSDTPF